MDLATSSGALEWIDGIVLPELHSGPYVRNHINRYLNDIQTVPNVW